MFFIANRQVKYFFISFIICLLMSKDLFNIILIHQLRKIIHYKFTQISTDITSIKKIIICIIINTLAF